MMKEKQYVFWSYDLFPYLLWDELVKLDDDGFARVKGYGCYRFRPKFILPEQDALTVISQLEGMKTTLRSITETYKTMAYELIKHHEGGKPNGRKNMRRKT
jgi:hypothetical protein